MEFFKLQGCGNSFAVVSQADLSPETDREDFARKLSSPAWGLGTDGVMLVGDPQDAPIEIDMRNPDGSLMGMCGNGIRCVVRYLQSLALSAPHLPEGEWVEFRVEGKLYECRSENEGRWVSVRFSPASFVPAAIPLNLSKPLIRGELSVSEGRPILCTALSVGNPHCVLFDVGLEETETLGPVLENHEAFPSRTNVEFVQVESRDLLRVRVWERGAGPTLACGTGACAAAVAYRQAGLVDNVVRIELPGGTVTIDLSEPEPVLIGPAAEIASGELYLSF